MMDCYSSNSKLHEPGRKLQDVVKKDEVKSINHKVHKGHTTQSYNNRNPLTAEDAEVCAEDAEEIHSKPLCPLCNPLCPLCLKKYITKD